MECSVGEKIMIFRKRQQMSKKQLADITEISSTTISNYESGKTRPSAENIVKIALALGVSLDELVSFRTPDTEEKSILEQLKLQYESSEIVSRYFLENSGLLLQLPKTK